MKLPRPKLAVQTSGGSMPVAAVLPVTGIWPDLAALALVPFLLLPP